MGEKKDIAKLPATKLREIALKIPEIEGVYGMNKQQLIEAIKAAQGLREEESKKVKSQVDISLVKKQIRNLKAERNQAIANRDRTQLKEIRKKLKKLKRITRMASA
jgi:protein-arginine kinase activator protein McsA